MVDWRYLNDVAKHEVLYQAAEDIWPVFNAWDKVEELVDLLESENFNDKEQKMKFIKANLLMKNYLHSHGSRLKTSYLPFIKETLFDEHFIKKFFHFYLYDCAYLKVSDEEAQEWQNKLNYILKEKGIRGLD